MDRTSVTGSLLGVQTGFLPTVRRLPNTMADNMNEELDYNPGKDELDWGYEEGRLVFINMWRDARKNVSWYKKLRVQMGFNGV